MAEKCLNFEQGKKYMDPSGSIFEFDCRKGTLNYFKAVYLNPKIKYIKDISSLYKFYPQAYFTEIVVGEKIGERTMTEILDQPTPKILEELKETHSANVEGGKEFYEACNEGFKIVFKVDPFCSKGTAIMLIHPDDAETMSKTLKKK